MEYAGLGMMNDEDVEDACDTLLSEVLPVRDRNLNSGTSTTSGITGFVN